MTGMVNKIPWSPDVVLTPRHTNTRAHTHAYLLCPVCHVDRLRLKIITGSEITNQSEKEWTIDKNNNLGESPGNFAENKSNPQFT